MDWERCGEGGKGCGDKGAPLVMELACKNEYKREYIKRKHTPPYGSEWFGELGYGRYGDEASRELRRGSCRQMQW